jgi:hypothetical protein
MLLATTIPSSGIGAALVISLSSSKFIQESFLAIPGCSARRIARFTSSNRSKSEAARFVRLIP